MIDKHLKGIDAVDKVNDLPNTATSQVRQGKYKLREDYLSLHA